MDKIYENMSKDKAVKIAYDLGKKMRLSKADKDRIKVEIEKKLEEMTFPEDWFNDEVKYANEVLQFLVMNLWIKN